MVPTHDTDFYIPPEHLGVAASVITVAVFGVLVLPGLVLFALARMRLAARLAVEAAEAGASTRKLHVGHAVVRGVVGGGEPATPVVTVRIRQVGSEYHAKTGLRHRWLEVGREVDTRPFQLRLASGETVLVDPGRNVILADPLGLPAGARGPERTRVASIVPGERVYVEGQLFQAPASGAYREGPTAFTLRPADGERLLISVDPLERRHEDRAKRHRACAVGLAVAALVPNAAFGTFWLGSLFGTVQRCRIVDLHTQPTPSKGRAHYSVVAELGPGVAPVTEEVSREAYQEALVARTQGKESWVPFVVLPAGLGQVVGERPTLYSGALALGVFVTVIAPLLYGWRVRYRRPWYERAKIVDDGEGGLAPQTHPSDDEPARASEASTSTSKDP